MDAVLCLREATHFQSMELERPEAICGIESGTRSRLWSTRGGCACRQEVAFFGLRLARTEIEICARRPEYFGSFDKGSTSVCPTGNQDSIAAGTLAPAESSAFHGARLRQLSTMQARSRRRPLSHSVRALSCVYLATFARSNFHGLGVMSGGASIRSSA
jgi:hypothetical protein